MINKVLEKLYNLYKEQNEEMEKFVLFTIGINADIVKNIDYQIECKRFSEKNKYIYSFVNKDNENYFETTIEEYVRIFGEKQALKWNASIFSKTVVTAPYVINCLYNYRLEKEREKIEGIFESLRGIGMDIRGVAILAKAFSSIDSFDISDEFKEVIDLYIAEA